MRSAGVSGGRRYLYAIIAIAAGFVVLFAIDHNLFGDAICGFLGEDVFKLTYQFLIITVLGGGVVAFFNLQKDEESRREADRRQEQLRQESRSAAIQGIDREISTAYRSIKQIRRNLHVRLVTGPSGHGSHEIDAKIYDDSMKQLHDVQIELEQIRDEIQRRGDLFNVERTKRLRDALRYSARYILAVFEEQGKIGFQNVSGSYVIPQSSIYVSNFIYHRRSKSKALIAAEGEDDRSRSLADDYRIIRQMIDDHSAGEPRFWSGAVFCFRFASKDLFDAALSGGESRMAV